MFAGIIHSKSGALQDNTRNKSPEWTSETLSRAYSFGRSESRKHFCLLPVRN
jgi:hypothetical protein